MIFNLFWELERLWKVKSKVVKVNELQNYQNTSYKFSIVIIYLYQGRMDKSKGN